MTHTHFAYDMTTHCLRGCSGMNDWIDFVVLFPAEQEAAVTAKVYEAMCAYADDEDGYLCYGDYLEEYLEGTQHTILYRRDEFDDNYYEVVRWLMGVDD